MTKKLDINYEKTCSCPDNHINCLTAKDWVRNQVAIWEELGSGFTTSQNVKRKCKKKM